jgi:hypothetical protein
MLVYNKQFIIQYARMNIKILSAIFDTEVTFCVSSDSYLKKLRTLSCLYVIISVWIMLDTGEKLNRTITRSEKAVISEM